MIEVKKITNYRGNKELITQIMGLIGPSYKNAGSHITKDIEICDELYYINSSSDGKMIAFFMVGYHLVEGVPHCYLGLSACAHEFKSTGIVKNLYLQFQRDCRVKQSELKRPIICYCTTATPIVFSAFHRLFIDTQPSFDGRCTEQAKSGMLKIIRRKYPDALFDPGKPFILRQAAKNISYSDAEKERINAIEQKLGITIFSENEINEAQGDRILMFGYVP